MLCRLLGHVFTGVLHGNRKAHDAPHITPQPEYTDSLVDDARALIKLKESTVCTDLRRCGSKGGRQSVGQAHRTSEHTGQDLKNHYWYRRTHIRTQSRVLESQVTTVGHETVLPVREGHWTGTTQGTSARSSPWRQGPTSMGNTAPGGTSSCGSMLQVQGPYRLYTCTPPPPTLKGAMPSPPLRPLPPSSNLQVSRPLRGARLPYQNQRLSASSTGNPHCNTKHLTGNCKQ